MIEPIFATPIYKSDSLYQFSTEELDCLNSLKLSNNANNSSSVDLNILKKTELEKLYNWCQVNVDTFLTELGKDEKAEIYITKSWLNKNKTNKFHHPHHHPNSIVSAILYVDGEPTVPTLFHNSNNFSNFMFYNKGNMFNSNLFQVTNENGRLILFPSYLSHSVGVNTSNKTRVSISFNTFIKGTFGYSNYQLNIN